MGAMANYTKKYFMFLNVCAHLSGFLCYITTRNPPIHYIVFAIPHKRHNTFSGRKPVVPPAGFFLFHLCGQRAKVHACVRPWRLSRRNLIKESLCPLALFIAKLFSSSFTNISDSAVVSRLQLYYNEKWTKHIRLQIKKHTETDFLSSNFEVNNESKK